MAVGLALTISAIAIPCDAAESGPVPNPRATVPAASDTVETPSPWRFGLGLAYKRLAGDWRPAQHQPELAIDAAYRPGDSWLSATLGIAISFSPAVPSLAGAAADFCGTYEVMLGARADRAFGPKWRVYAGGAGGLIGASTSDSDVIVGYAGPSFTPVYAQGDRDVSAGVRLDVGATHRVGASSSLGARVGWTHGTLEMFGRHLDAGGVEAGLLWSWDR